MLRKLYILPVIGLMITGALLSGCKKLIEIDPPLNEVSSELVFKSDKTAKSALAGLYVDLAATQTQAVNFTAFSALQADDMEYVTAGNTTYDEFNNNSSIAASSGALGVFSDWYAIIYRANAIIEGLAKYTGTTAAVNKELTAEAKFIRAYCYFNLVNTFGDVPLIVETDVNVTAYLPRVATSVVYTQIVQDLTDAKANLLADYSFTASDRLGANQFAAEALLARVNLYLGNYAAAESNASDVISSSLYSMVPADKMGTGLFIKNSTEAILQLPSYLNATTQYTQEASTFIPSAYNVASVFWKIRSNLVDVFASADLRKKNWMKEAGDGTNVFTPYKFKYKTSTLAIAANVSECPMILRLAEQYLIRAEARAKIGTNISGALADLNVVHTRAGLSESTTIVPAALIEEIALENRKEFFCEQAHRWFDLKRTGRVDAVIGALKPTYKPTSQLLPIPQGAIDANPNLTQNPGY